MDRSEKEISGYAHPKPRSRAAEKDGFRPDIEGLRGVAVSLVVLFHAGLLSLAPTQLTGGFIGVDLFFVVSGYLITGLLIRERERTGRISFAKFYARRVRRILPAAAVVLLITIPLANGLVTLVQRSSVMEDGASAALSIANIRFAMTTDYFNPVNYSPFLHFWSLGVEEQFYFVWPAILAIVAWKFPRAGAAAALSVILVASFIASLIVTDNSAPTAFYMLPTRAWPLAPSRPAPASCSGCRLSGSSARSATRSTCGTGRCSSWAGCTSSARSVRWRRSRPSPWPRFPFPSPPPAGSW